jgi:hypothetical protein
MDLFFFTYTKFPLSDCVNNDVFPFPKINTGAHTYTVLFASLPSLWSLLQQ